MAPLKILKSQATDTAFMILSIPCLLSCLSANFPTTAPQAPRALRCFGFTVSSVFPFDSVAAFIPSFYYFFAFLHAVVLAFAVS